MRYRQRDTARETQAERHRQCDTARKIQPERHSQRDTARQRPQHLWRGNGMFGLQQCARRPTSVHIRLRNSSLRMLTLYAHSICALTLYAHSICSLYMLTLYAPSLYMLTPYAPSLYMLNPYAPSLYMLTVYDPHSVCALTLYAHCMVRSIDKHCMGSSRRGRQQWKYHTMGETGSSEAQTQPCAPG